MFLRQLMHPLPWHQPCTQASPTSATRHVPNPTALKYGPHAHGDQAFPSLTPRQSLTPSPLELGSQPCHRQMTVIPTMTAMPATQSKRQDATHKVMQLSTKVAQTSSPPAENTPALSFSVKRTNNDVDISVLINPDIFPTGYHFKD